MSKLKTITSVESFLSVLEQSQICSAEQLAELKTTIEEKGLGAPKQIARFLIDCEAITLWQARRLLAGITQFRIGNYVLLEQVGSSGMGRVFLAHHGPLKRKVAIKAFHRELTQDPRTARNLLEECQQAAALDHRNLIHIYDVDEDRGRIFLVMEYVDGTNLRDYVEGHHPLPTLTALELLEQAAAALGHLHDNGFIHGHVRPENILVEESGRVKLIGLGGRSLREMAALPVEDDTIPNPAGDPPTEPNETASGESACYHAPEEFSGSAPTTRSDVFALGCAAYYVLTGTAPYGSVESLQSPEEGQPTPLHQLRPELPKPVARVVGRMMARRPADRYRDATIVTEVLADLRATLEDSPSFLGREQAAASAGSPHQTDATTAATDGPASHRKRLWLVAALLLLLLGTGGVAGWWYYGGDDSGVAQHNTTDTSGALEIASDQDQSEDASDTADTEGSGTSPTPGDRTAAVGSPEEFPELPQLPVNDQATGQAASAKKDGDDVEPVALNGKPTKGAAATAPPPDEPPEPDSETGKSPEPKPASPKPAESKDLPEKKSTAKTPDKAKQSNKKKASPQPPAVQPFAKLPRQVALPLPTAGTSAVVIGPVHLGPRDLVFVQLRGGSQAVKGTGTFEVGAAQGGLSSRAWTISFVDNDKKTPIATLDMEGGALRFRWDANAAKLRQASGLLNTVLKLTTRGHVHTLQLRKPIVGPALPVDLSRSSTTARWKIDAMPDPVVVFCEVTKLSEGFPKAAYDPDKTIPLARKSLRIRLGEKPEESLFFLELGVKSTRSSVSVTVTPYFQPSLDAEPTKITSKDVRSLLRLAQTRQQQLTARIAQIKQLQKAATKASREQKAQLAQALNLAEQELQQVANQLTQLNKLNDLQTGLKGAAIHLRFYARVGEDQIDLLHASGPIDD